MCGYHGIHVLIFNFYASWNLFISLREDGLNSPSTALAQPQFFTSTRQMAKTSRNCTEKIKHSTERDKQRATWQDINSREMTTY